jgi:hypothetical protein
MYVPFGSRRKYLQDRVLVGQRREGQEKVCEVTFMIKVKYVHNDTEHTRDVKYKEAMHTSWSVDPFH